MARSKSSGKWLAEHFSDEFVKRARKEGYRSRAVYKLKEIDERDRLFRPGMTVVDLGAAPGAWTQYVKERVGKAGRIVALDILPMDAVPGVEVLQADFNEESSVQRLLDALAGQPVDLVISDIAPNISGIDSADQARTMNMAELALDFAGRVLKPGGGFLVKVFQGRGFNEFFKLLQRRFARVASRKPGASRSRSAEIYLLATGWRGPETGASE